QNNNPLPQRKLPRLHGYDYSSNGAYFVTICTHQRYHLFGTITDNVMNCTSAGHMAQRLWLEIPQHFPYIELDLHVIMPNHMHGIIVITEPDQHNLSTVIGSYKSAVTRHLRQQRAYTGQKIWQVGFQDHIIRNEASWNTIRQYVQTNPARWHDDTFYS
ncbi:MAG: transposase, partial [Chloroflexota bacterium]